MVVNSFQYTLNHLYHINYIISQPCSNVIMQTKFIFALVAITMLMGGTAIVTGTYTYGQLQQPKTITNSTQQYKTSTVSAANETTGWLDSFNLENCNFASHGANNYFILEPGYQFVLRGQEDSKTIEMIATVLSETKIVNGTEVGILEEKAIEDGELAEISKNYFAVCAETNDIFYFGEDTDWYKDGKIVSHEGTWLAGDDNAKPGMIMPGEAKIGLKYYQELAPGLDEGRAEVISLNEVLDTPVGKIKNVLKTEETTPLEPGEKEYKFYAPGIGLVQDNTLKLVNYTAGS
jgi:hypothetical protein